MDKIDAQRILDGWCRCGHDSGHHGRKDKRCDFNCDCGPIERELVEEARRVLDPPEHILQFFAYEHLPEPLRSVSKPFCDMAHAIVGDTPIAFPPLQLEVNHLALPRNPERTVALRKLLEAKDAAVRAKLAK